MTVSCMRLLWLPEYRQTPCFALYNAHLHILQECGIVKQYGLKLILTAVNRIIKAGAKSEKESQLHFTIQPFADSCLKPFHPCTCLLKRLARLFLSKICIQSDNISTVYCAFDRPDIKIFRRFLGNHFHTLGAFKRTAQFTHSRY